MIVFSRRVRSRLKYPTSISTSFGSATAASVETKGRYAHADAGMSRAANSGGRILIGHGLEDEHLRCGPALFLLRRRVHAVGPPVDRQAVNLRLHREVLQLSETGRTVHLKYGDCATGAGHINASEPRIEHRSEERRVGKEWRSRWYKKNKKKRSQ